MMEKNQQQVGESLSLSKGDFENYQIKICFLP